MSERRNEPEHHSHHDLAVEEARPRLKKPPLYRVLLLNDDYTPMEFVVEILEGIFGMQRTRATQVMLEVHTKGQGICGEYGFEIAETKVAQVMSTLQYALEAQRWLHVVFVILGQQRRLFVDELG